MRYRLLALGALLLSLDAAENLNAQAFPDTRRAQATRDELSATLSEIERVIESEGYSNRLRQAKRQEAELIRERLEEGDFRVGDQIVLYVEGQPALIDTFTIAAGRVLPLPGFPVIPMERILRSEAEEHLQRELSRYIRSPVVRAQAMIRLSVGGTVGRPGFYHLPANVLVSEAIMAAGGPVERADPNRSEVRRVDRIIIPREEFQEALVAGVTLDQLNLRAGDEILVDPGRNRGLSWQTIGVIASVAASLTILVSRF